MRVVFFFKQKTAYEMRISDWSSDVCSSDLRADSRGHPAADVADLVEGRVLAHLGQRDLRQHREVGEGRVAHAVKRRLALQREAAGAVRPEPLAPGHPARLDVVCLGFDARMAMTAPRRVRAGGGLRPNQE